jgi:cytochrome P450
MALNAIQAATDEKGSSSGHERETVIASLIKNKSLSSKEKTVRRLSDEGFSFVMASSESTAQNMAAVFYHLSENPGILKKLRAELMKVNPDPQAPITMPMVEQIPYLVTLLPV